MFWRWLKYFMPRGLYGRAALILIAPIVTVQIVVSFAFLQRHFEDVTEQLTSAVALELAQLRRIASEDGVTVASDLGAGLGLHFSQLPAPDWAAAGEERRLIYDLSGRVVIARLRHLVPEITWIDLASDDRMVHLGLEIVPGEEVSVSLQRRRVSTSNPHQLIVILLLTGILMTAVSFVFLRNQLRPIRRLARAAEAFGKGRHLPYKPSGAIEVRAAGRAFLDMRARIERQIEQRTLMLSGVSHDLRTPLTRMKLGLSMMDPLAETGDLERDVAEMEALLTTFLDFARADALDDPEPCDVLALLRGAAADAARLGGEISLDLPQEAPEMSLRPHAVQRALSNLIGNALRYGSRARISLYVLERAIRISVEDDGPGIAPEDRSAALRAFVRLDPSRNQDRGSGVGLGLAIASDIARSHGGSLRLGQSEDLGGLRADLVLAR